MVRRTIAGLLTATLLLALSAGSRGVNAATINVACNTTALIQAIETANGSPGPDTLELASSCTYTLTSAYGGTFNGLPVIGSAITINGNGSTIARDPSAGAFRIFQVGDALTLNDVTVTGGHAPDGGPGSPGQSGGAIFLNGSLTMTRTAITGNSAGNGGSSIIGGRGGDGGGIAMAAATQTMSISNSTISGNHAGNGGASSEFLTNGRAGGSGGGIFVDGNNTGSITSSTISGNSAGSGGTGGTSAFGGSGGSGGGIHVAVSINTGITNSTISGNSAGNGGLAGPNGVGGSGGSGGAIRMVSGSLTLTNGTLSDNAAGTGGTPGIGGGVSTMVAIISKNSIIANSFGANCDGSIDPPSINNMASDASCGASSTQKTQGEINLGPLANNGGATQTRALNYPSAAIDAGDNATCATAPVNNLDQRGVVRPADGDGAGGAVCDIGAYEGPALQTGPQFIANSTAPDNDGACHPAPGDCTIREAINAANADGLGSEIQLGSAQTYTLTGVDNAGNGLPVISTEIGIFGNGSTIARDPAAPLFRLFQVPAGGTLLLDNVTVSGGEATGASGDGGGIYVNGGQLVLVHSRVSGNRAAMGATGINGSPGRHGGGIAISSGGGALIMESTINGNVAGTGGAGTELNGGAGGNGGGVALLGGTLTIERSLVSVNFAGGGRFTGANGSGGAGGFGGGLYLAGGSSATISNTTIYANAAGGGAVGTTGNGNGGSGGGMASPSAIVTLTNLTFSDNNVGAAGGPNAANGTGSGIYGDGAGITIRNTIAANGPGGNCGSGSIPQLGSGTNISTDASCGASFTQRTLGQINFGTFGNNGGPTSTLPLVLPSAAIDTGDFNACQNPPVFNVDQRGYPRPLDGDSNGTATCDIGAYEYCIDGDGDSACDFFDNCPTTANANQADGDFDGPGDACDNCPSATNQGQENSDADPVGDACDNCPATANADQANFDGDAQGDACDTEDDGDGYTDEVEAGTPLCKNTANDDAFDPTPDTAVNDGCPAVGPAESDCSDTQTPPVGLPVDDDFDGLANDGCPQVGSFSEAVFKIGTGPLDPCGYDGWPSNVWDAPPSDNRVDVQDLISFIAPLRRLDTNPTAAGYLSRWDLAPGANSPFPNHISIFDITTILNGTPGSPAYPPMFGGPRAFLKDCPFAP